MTFQDREALLAYARTCVENSLEGREIPIMKNPSPDLAGPGAVFATLLSEGDLRGCIGRLEETEPLWKCVKEMVVAAATRDHRFSPLKKGEPFTIELSILSPPFLITPEEIKIGTHGLVAELKKNRGVLLPHVATKNNWTPVQFLHHTILKAALPLTVVDNPEFILRAFTTDLISEI